MKTLFLLFLSLNIYSQITFTRVESDSILSKLYDYQYLKKENASIKYVLDVKDARINNLTSQVETSNDIISNYEETMQIDDQVITNFEKLYKREKKRKWGWLIKGALIGGGTVLILTSL